MVYAALPLVGVRFFLYSCLSAPPPPPQVDKTQELTDEAKRKADGVITQARSVGNNARSIAKAAERQTEALEKAKKLMPTVEAATKRALESLR